MQTLGQGMEGSLLVGMRNGVVTLVERLVVSYKTKHGLNDPLLMLLRVCPADLKTYVYTKPCTLIFTEALFIIALNRKQVKFSR